MSNAIGQSATAMAASVGVTEDNYPFSSRLAKIASQKVTPNTITLERQSLVRSKLKSALCQDYRSHFCAIYGKTDRFPSSVVDKMDIEIEKYIASQLNRVNSSNVLSIRRSFHHNPKKAMVTERETIIGENIIDLQKQHCGIVLFIGSNERRLKMLEQAGRLTDELEQTIMASINQCNATKAFIEAEMEHQRKKNTEESAK